MKYICYKPFEGMTAGLGKKLITRNDEFESVGKLLIRDNAVVCRLDSQIAYEHFARNDDGCGLERGDLANKIAFGDRRVSYNETVVDYNTNPETGEKTVIGSHIEKVTAMMLPEEVEYLKATYPTYFVDDNGNFRFKREFFEADIEDLRKIAYYLKLPTETEEIKSNVTDIEMAVVENYEMTTESLTDLEVAICEIYEQLSNSAVDYTE